MSPSPLVYLSNTSEEARKLGEVLQQQLGEVGIRLDIKLVTSSAFITAAINGEGDLIRNAGGRFGADPSVTSLYYTCKAGWSELVIGYCNPEFDDLMAQGVAVSDPDARQADLLGGQCHAERRTPQHLLLHAQRLLWGQQGAQGTCAQRRSWLYDLEHRKLVPGRIERYSPERAAGRTACRTA